MNKDETVRPKLTKAQVAGLVEISHYDPGESREGLFYWWRPKTMASLELLGFVEKWTPGSIARWKSKPWRITDAGRTALREASNVKG